MRVLLLASHGIAEYDDVRMFARLGYDVFSPGGYSDPAHPGETLRPAIPEAPQHPDLVALCHLQRVKHEGQPAEFGIADWAKADLHPDLIEWADAIIVHHFPETWVGGQWEAIRHKRVIWRTCGQSNPRLEHTMRPFHDLGMQIVRYSPAERRAFEPLGTFAGEDALIRFGKDPADYGPWIGDDLVVGNVTQNLDIRGDHCGYGFWQEATKDLPTRPAGTGSERLPNGTGELSYDAMREYLRHLRAYLYMGTQPASYTLALIEAMLSGVPVVSMGPDDLWMPTLFEGHEIAPLSGPARAASDELATLLRDRSYAESVGRIGRDYARDLFGLDVIGPQWLRFLGNPVSVTFQIREAVTA